MMARRKKPTIKGNDPAYSHQFSAFRPVPNNMPPDVNIPGVSKEEERPVPPEAITATPEPEKAKEERPTPARRKRSASRPPAATETPPVPEKPHAGKKPEKEGPTRLVRLEAALTPRHVEAMKPLVKKGFDQRDVVAVAGRRTVAQFQPDPVFVPNPEADRLPMRQAYRSTKCLPADLLDKLRDEHDPLRLKSDTAMVRGQFETLFWSILDDVIAELKKA